MIVGTAGHIDHGKTELVRALSGVYTDRLREEKARGISIDLGFAYLPAPDGGIIGFVDVPGHERFIRNMLAGATGIDFVVLVVAADDGVMPQTIEHLAIISLLGIERGLVALTKADLVTPERLEAAEAEVAELLAGSSMPHAAIVPVSAPAGVGIDHLREALFAAAASFGRNAASGRFRLAVDRCFTLAGSGTVVTGTVLSGSVALGDRVLISPAGRAAQVRSVHAQNRPAERGRAGDRCALNLSGRDVRKDAIARGDMVLDAALHAPADRIDASLHILPTETKQLVAWTPVRLHHATVEIGARVVPLSAATMAPGAQGFAQLVLDKPIAATAGDRFILRETSGQRTLGGGRFLDLRAPARRRRRPERLALLNAHAQADPQDALGGLLDQPAGFVDLSVFVRDRALGDDEVERIVAATGAMRFAHAGGIVALAPARWSQVKAELRAALEKFHAEKPALPGVGVERLRHELVPALPRDAFIAMLRALARSERISLEGGWVRLASQTVEMSDADKALWRKIAPLIGGAARFRPPRVRDIARTLAMPEPEVRQVMQRAGRQVLVYEVAHDRFFLRASLAEIAAIVGALSAAAPSALFSLAQLRDRLDTSRKIAMEILDFLDHHQATARRGDWRRVNAARLDVFRTAAE